MSTRALAAGEVFLRELPQVGRQTPPSRLQVLACGCPGCLAPLTSVPTAQLSLLAGHCSRASLATGEGGGHGAAPDGDDDNSAAAAAALAAGGACWCEDGCGEVYCSAACRRAAAPSHRLLCVGPVPDDWPDHPLLRFKLHALRCNEAFLLAAEVVASLLAELGAATATATARGAAAAKGRAACWIEHYMPDGPRLWWDVAQQPPRMSAAGVSLATFRDSCRAHVSASASLLQAALSSRGACGEEVSALLEVDGFYGQLMGLFELYSMGVRVGAHSLCCILLKYPPTAACQCVRACLAR